MNYSILISIFCLLVIASYLFDMVARKTKFPSVILLILSGMMLKVLAQSFDYEIPESFMKEILPSLGNIGLILIVLEGALELKINSKKKGLILRSLLAAFLILSLTSLTIAYAFYLFSDYEVSFLLCMQHSVPFGVISSAVAIPSVSTLKRSKKEFIIYESTFSDIWGIVLFNFILSNESIQPKAFGKLGLDIFLVFIASLVVTYFLLQLMARISHHVKFFLILSILILTFIIGKYYHLSTLIIVFFFGLFLKNAQQIVPEQIKRYLPIEKTEEDLQQFFLLTAESAFLIRTFFFLFFGFSIHLEKLTYWDAYLKGFGILLVIFAVRGMYLGFTQPRKMIPEFFISPRGLISILLFLQLYEHLDARNQLDFLMVKENTLLIVILGSMLVMMVGIVKFGKQKDGIPPPSQD